MGMNGTKSSFSHNTDYSLILSSKKSFYRCSTIIQGELHLHIRKSLFIEKKIRIDLIGQLIEKNSPHREHIFFTYSFPLVTSHDNGIEKILKNQQISFPFRIPLSPNLPPTCDLPPFSIVYYLDIFHDDHLIPNLRKQLIIAPVVPHVIIPSPYQVTGSNDVMIICRLAKSVYSIRENSVIPLNISLINPHENEIWTRLLNEIEENTREKQIDTTILLNLPLNLSPSTEQNINGHADNLPSIGIKYEFRLTIEMEGLITPNLNLVVPIGIE